MITYTFNKSVKRLYISTGEIVNFSHVKGNDVIKHVSTYCLKQMQRNLINVAYKLASERRNAAERVNYEPLITQSEQIQMLIIDLENSLAYSEMSFFKGRFSRILHELKAIFPKQESRFWINFNNRYNELERDLNYFFNSSINWLKIEEKAPVEQLTLFN